MGASRPPAPATSCLAWSHHWAPVAAGGLTRPGGPVDRIAAAHGATPAQVALAWLLAHSEVTLPIPGTSKVAHLEDNTAAAQLRLSGAEIDELTSS
ncbi:aldo/keto reductase [Streptomyces solisilvae]|uniref:aldo/keto reductase n=1 Tax=Streptomyces malaysiensis TaxID=92644 RepID=UPI003675D3AD